MCSAQIIKTNTKTEGVMEYRKIESKDLAMVVNTHIKCFPGYFLTMLGSKVPSKAGDSLLAKYYHEFLIENPTLFVGAFDREQMVGFCMGYMRPSRARARFEKKNAIKLS